MIVRAAILAAAGALVLAAVTAPGSTPAQSECDRLRDAAIRAVDRRDFSKPYQEEDAAIPPADAHSLQIDGLGVTILSWGKLVRVWSIYPDGSGQLRWRRQPVASRDAVLVTQHLDPVAGRYEQVEALLRSAESYAGGELPCESRATDLPYGGIQWRRAGHIQVATFNFGCTAGVAQQVRDQIETADAMIDGWATNAPIIDERAPPEELAETIAEKCAPDRRGASGHKAPPPH